MALDSTDTDHFCHSESSKASTINSNVKLRNWGGVRNWRNPTFLWNSLYYLPQELFQTFGSFKLYAPLTPHHFQQVVATPIKKLDKLGVDLFIFWVATSTTYFLVSVSLTLYLFRGRSIIISVYWEFLCALEPTLLSYI